MLPPAHLGTGNSNLRSGIDVHSTMRLPRNRAPDRIHNAYAQRTPLKTIPHRQNGVRRLPRLTQKHAHIVPEDRRLAVHEVARKLD